MSSDTVAVPDDWFVGFHQGLAARFWRAAGAAMLEADLARVRRALDLPPGAAVLDVPCGDGRIALGLARAGHRVTGVDIAPAEVELATASAAAGLDARFLTGDLRALPVTGPFDAVVSWGNSFGYLDAGGQRALARRACAPCCGPAAGWRSSRCASPRAAARRRRRARGARVRRRADDARQPLRRRGEPRRERVTFTDADGRSSTPGRAPRPHVRRGRADAARGRVRRRRR